MKKIVLASIVILSAFFTSCAKSNLVVEPDGANTLRAVMENSDDSRTTLEYNGNVVWSASDKLSVFNQADQSQQAEYTLIQGEGTTSAVFQSNKPIGAGVKYAFYPAGATCASDVISFNLPATQAYAKASFANGSNPMVAKSNAQGELLFQNLCGVIKFQLTGTATVASVKMETAGEVVAGAMTVKMDYTGAPAMEVAKTGTTSTSITLTDCNVSLSESVNSTFYFTVPAGTYAAGLRFTAYNSAGEVIRTKATSADLEVLRSHIASLPGASEKLYFPDPIFRAKLVEKYQFVQTADGTDIDITNPANAALLKTDKLDVSTTGSASRAAVATPAKIASLKGIEYFTELTELECKGNELTALDVSANKKLTVLKCGDNLLPALDIKANTALTTLECGNNKLTELILTNNTALTTLKCANNQLKALDIRATSITEASKLTCGEQTSDGTTKQDISLSLTTAQKDAKLGESQAKFINFPDANFRARLGTLGFVPTTDGTDIDIKNTTNAGLLNSLQWPDLSSANITDLTGIEHFKELTSLICHHNELTELNLSKLAKLKYVYCANNKLTKLDVSNNKTIEELECYNNTLTDLKVNGVTTLTRLNCNTNQLKTLDVNGCTALTEIRCNTNLLTGLTLNNTALATLDCHDNQLNTLNVGGCSALTTLFCHENKLTTLTLNTALKNLHCHDNLLSTLTLNAALTELRCYNNQLNALVVSGCTALKTLKCSGNKLNALDLSQNVALKVLDCSGNTFTNGLDVSHNGALTELVCSGNALTTLTLTANKALSTLHCQNNQLGTLTLTDNVELAYLFCYGNRMDKLDITTLSKLTALQCGLQTTNGTTAKDLELTLTQDQSDKGLSVGTNNDRVNDKIYIKL